jgi:uncharacterized protein YraI
MRINLRQQGTTDGLLNHSAATWMPKKPQYITVILLLCIVFALTIPNALAADYGYMVVSPLPPGDALNERSGPGSSYSVIRRLDPGTLVAAEERKMNGNTAWRRLDGDGGGWVAERYLQPAQFRKLNDSTIPVSGNCSGFEPIWSLKWSANALKFRTPEQETTYELTDVVPAEGFTYGLLFAKKNQRNWAIFRFEQAQCHYLPLESFLYGRGMLIINQGDEIKWYVGCCSPTKDALLPISAAKSVKQ